MAYSYSKANFYSLKDDTKYFLDANIWLKILQPKLDSSTKDLEYRKLFEKIAENTKCKIVLPALILSEVINRILREVHMGKFVSKMRKSSPSFAPDKHFYKNVFRISPEFKIAYSLVCDEIKNYHSTIELLNDGLGVDFKFKHILKDLPSGLDFNDHYYYQLCKKNNFVLITDDKDFWVEDIEIVTMSSSLLDRHIALLVKDKTD
jgi:predicted nucleic acid-binding protein